MVVLQLGGKGEDIWWALCSFWGIWWWFEFLYCSENWVYIDDYVYYLEELWAVIGVVKELFLDCEVIGIF